MTVVIVDTEATDKDPKTAKVIELGELILRGDPSDLMMSGDIGEPESWLYGTKEPIKWGAMATHHILPADIEGKPEFLGWPLGDRADFIIGHNIDFDAELLGLSRNANRICTLALARGLLPDLDAHTQTALVYYICGQRGDLESARSRLQNSHRASDDVANCAFVLRYLLNIAFAQGHNIDSWNQVWQLSEKCRLPTKMMFGKHAGERIEHVPLSYVKWYRTTDNQDPYLVEAWRRHGMTR